MCRDMIIHALILGIIATIAMDLIAIFQKRAFGIPSLNYAMVGRWLGHIPKGRVIHRPITQSAPIAAEAAIGWAAHYLIGVGFAAVYLGSRTAVGSTGLGPMAPILFGAATVAAPFFLLQPALGAGIAARRTPNPWIARMRSLIAHITFGIGLWIGTLILSQFDLM